MLAERRTSVVWLTTAYGFEKKAGQSITGGRVLNPDVIRLSCCVQASHEIELVMLVGISLDLTNSAAGISVDWETILNKA